MMCQVDDGNIAEICDKLRQDALHNLSLGSKELFHSDFLAWFAQSYPEEAAHVFSGYARPGDPGRGQDRAAVAEREHEHLDLILRLPGLQLIVIENKVWSLPDDAQLQAYAAGPISRLGTDTAQILLSLTPPAWDEPGARMLGGRRWDYLSYRELADRLEPVAERLGKSAGATTVSRANSCSAMRPG